MDAPEAEKILANTEAYWYARPYGGTGVSLDGVFSIEELQAIIVLYESEPPPPPAEPSFLQTRLHVGIERGQWRGPPYLVGNIFRDQVCVDVVDGEIP